MRGKDLLECMEQIDDVLVEEALEPAAFSARNHLLAKLSRFLVPGRTGGADHGNNKAAKWGMAAACVIVLGVSTAAFWSHQNAKRMPDGNARDMASPMSAATDADGGVAGQAPEDGALSAGNAADDAGQTAAGGVLTTGNGGDIQPAGGLQTTDSMTDSTSALAKTEADKEESKENENSAVADMLDETKKQGIAVQECMQYTIISDYYGEKDVSVYDYPAPQRGEFYCYHYLSETMEYYEEQKNTAGTTNELVYAYHVVIDLYGETSDEDNRGTTYRALHMPATAAGNEKLEQEYRRLAELGYQVRLSEDFELTGTFTKEELDTFQASPEYGYTFRFADEY